MLSRGCQCNCIGCHQTQCAQSRKLEPTLGALADLRAVNLELDAEEQSRQEGDLRVSSCNTVRWSRSRQQQFQDSTSSVAIEQARLLINCNKWCVSYMNTQVATVFDKAMRKLCKVRKVRQRMTDYAAYKAAEAVKADSADADAATCGCAALGMLQRWRVFTVDKKLNSSEVQCKVAELTDKGSMHDMMEFPESWDMPWTCCKCTYVNVNQEVGFSVMCSVW